MPLPPYRHISGPEDEGAEFLAVLEEVAEFYLRTMRGQARLDGPGARMKFTRDWEYPWTLLRAGAAPGRRILDCGAGYSPLPFLWASRGASVQAIDRDALVASAPRYLLWCAARLLEDLAGEFRARRPAVDDGTRPTPVGRRPATAEPRPQRSVPRGRLGRFLRFHAGRNRERLARLSHPDFWGPVSPALLRRYRVAYTNGDLTRLPFAAASFDAVTCVSVLEHLPREARLRGVRDMARVLAPAGRLIITYDVVDGDISEELIDASGGVASELVYFHAASRLYAPGAPDVVGLVIDGAR